MEKLVKELMSLGLTNQEANIYIFFAQNNSINREEAMNQLEIGERELKNNLQRLTRKGFIETNPKDANEFSVVPLQVVMERLIKEKLKELQEIKGEIRNYKTPQG